MDGFGTTFGAVILAGTNSPDLLDKPVLTPVNCITITTGKPDVKDRHEIFEIHMKKLGLDNHSCHYAYGLLPQDFLLLTMQICAVKLI